MTGRVTMDHILCPTDFSEYSERAMRRAVGLARWFGAPVTAVHVMGIAPSAWLATGYGAYVPISEDLVRKWQDEAAEKLGRFVAPFMGADVPIETELIRGVDESNPWQAIKSVAEALPADLIVMGTHGRTGLEHVLLGSVAERVLRVAPCPVMTVGAKDLEQIGGPLFRRIVCATDLTGASRPTVEMALSLAQENLARLTLLHVVEDLHDDTSLDVYRPIPELGAFRRTLIDRANARLMQLAKPAHVFCDVNERVETGKAWREILRVAEETYADLIVTGARTGGALGRLFLGSTANQIVRHASCPVLVVREKRAATDKRPPAEARATQDEHSVTAAH